jgi:hypothetical protein
MEAPVKREELIDNLIASHERGETVTLTLRWVSGEIPMGKPVVKTGRVLMPFATHYTGKRADQCVFLPNGRRIPLVIGLGMITNFKVGA